MSYHMIKEYVTMQHLRISKLEYLSPRIIGVIVTLQVQSSCEMCRQGSEFRSLRGYTHT